MAQSCLSRWFRVQKAQSVAFSPSPGLAAGHVAPLPLVAVAGLPGELLGKKDLELLCGCPDLGPLLRGFRCDERQPGRAGARATPAGGGPEVAARVPEPCSPEGPLKAPPRGGRWAHRAFPSVSGHPLTQK